MIIALAVALTCTTVGNTVICDEVDARHATDQSYIAVMQRRCMSRIPASDRDKYPGGFIQLLRDCEVEAKLSLKALHDKATRSVDQNGVQR